MHRHDGAVGLIRCRADAATLNAIAETRGLSIEQAEKPSHYYLVDSRNELASELAAAVFAAVAYDLDHAVQHGRIPPWSALVRPTA